MAKTHEGIFKDELAVQFNGYLPVSLYEWLVEEAHAERQAASGTGERPTMSSIVRSGLERERKAREARARRRERAGVPA